MLFAYFGPETVLPLGSALAAVLGVFLMFGRQVIFMTRRAFGRIARLFRPGRLPKSAPAAPSHGGSVRYDGGDDAHAPHTPRTSDPRVSPESAAMRDSSGA
jgi:hypothetical protein